MTTTSIVVHDVKNTVLDLGIGLLFVRAVDQTHRWQPLDNNILSALKATARITFNALMASNNLQRGIDHGQHLGAMLGGLDTEFIKNAQKNTRNL